MKFSSLFLELFVRKDCVHSTVIREIQNSLLNHDVTRDHELNWAEDYQNIYSNHSLEYFLPAAFLRDF